MHNLSFVALYYISFTYFVWYNFYTFVGFTHQSLNRSLFLLLKNLLLHFSTFFSQYFI